LDLAEASLSEFVDDHYLPWIEENKSALLNCYRQIWNRYLKPRIGDVPFVDLKAEQLTELSPGLAEKGRLRKRTTA
jgi:hypothetical protein